METENLVWREFERLLSGIEGASSIVKLRQEEVDKAQKRLDDAKREVARWELAYSEHCDKLRYEARR